MDSLYEITKELQDIKFETLECTDDELVAFLTQAIDELEVKVDHKLIGCCAWVKNLESEAEMFKAEAKKLKDKADKLERQAEAFKSYIGKCLPHDVRWSGGVHSLSWRTSKAVALDVVPERLPPVYQRIKVEADKMQLKKDLEMGATVEGVRLEVKHNLQVK